MTNPAVTPGQPGTVPVNTQQRSVYADSEENDMYIIVPDESSSDTERNPKHLLFSVGYVLQNYTSGNQKLKPGYHSIQDGLKKEQAIELVNFLNGGAGQISDELSRSITPGMDNVRKTGFWK